MDKIKPPIHYKMNDSRRFNFATFYDTTDTIIDPSLIADALNAVADKDRQIAVLENRTACLTGEVTALRKTLKECRIKWDTADNGMCAVCRTGFRLFDLKGNVQKCENTECLSHRIDEALSYGDSCDICGKEMKSKGQEERIKNAIFGAHSNCLDVESQRIQEGENG